MLPLEALGGESIPGLFHLPVILATLDLLAALLFAQSSSALLCVLSSFAYLIRILESDI
jgi:hypothetical protein